ncbi:MAG: hypothetical protein QM736_04565 [Vicinamibacterales bacterium]
MSALHGDNVIAHSDRTPWFSGQPLLEFLETVQVDRDVTASPFRFPVQLVLRPSHDFRGYAGQVLSGTVRPGDAVSIWPSGRTSRVKQNRHLRRAPRYRAAGTVGHADARRRDRHQPGRHDRCRSGERVARVSARTSCGWTSGRSTHRASTC